MSSVTKNILFNLVGQALILALGFWGTRLVFHRLGDEALGILYFTIAIYTALTPILDMGVSSTLVREVASHLATDKEYVIRLTRTSTLFYCCGYLFLAAGIWLFAPWLVAHWITLKTLDTGTAVHALRILASGWVLMLPRSLYANLLRGVERMEFNNLIDVGTLALQQAGTILIVVRGGGLIEIAYCYAAALLLSILAYVLVASWFLPWRAFLPGFSGDVVRRNLPFTSRVGAYTLLSVIQMESDKAILSKLVAVGPLGFYGLAQTMVARANRITGAVATAALPNLSALFNRQDHGGLVKQYRKLQDLVCYGMIPVSAGLAFASRPLFTYLLNSEAAELLRWPTILLCVGWYMNATLIMPATVSLAVGRADIGAKQNLYALLIVTPVTVWLISEWRLIGAGLSVVIYHLYAYSYGARRVASECLGLRAWVWYFHVTRVLLLASLTYGVAWLLTEEAQNSISVRACAFGLASLVYLCVTYFFVGSELRSGLSIQKQRLSRAILSFGSD